MQATIFLNDGESAPKFMERREEKQNKKKSYTINNDIRNKKFLNT